jgi:hypothetical protein
MHMVDVKESLLESFLEKRSDVWRQKCSNEYDFVGCELPS